MISDTTETPSGTVALFNASDDTLDMIQKLLTESGHAQTLISCHFADLKKGVVDFSEFLGQHNPEVVVFDLSPPYDENWRFFVTVRDSKAMQGRGVVLTTTNKNRLDEVLGADSQALEVVGKAKDRRGDHIGDPEGAGSQAVRRRQTVGPPSGYRPARHHPTRQSSPGSPLQLARVDTGVTCRHYTLRHAERQSTLC